MTARLAARMVEKVWGMERLPPPFRSEPGVRIGEIWFEPPADHDSLLIKYIFTSEKLSVQTHPSDAQTRAKGLGSLGKDECWLVVSAEPGARLGIGFAEEITPTALRSAALDGSIERRMAWYPVEPGDFFYIPANTVHTIGAGVGLVEVQQNSDITYRLFDYGRPRELHLEAALAVAHRGPLPPACVSRIPSSGTARLVEGPYFDLTWIGGAAEGAEPEFVEGSFLVPIAGSYQIGAERIGAGECGLISREAKVRLDPEGSCLIAKSRQFRRFSNQ